MRWECAECGYLFERLRPPAVCRSCGTAGGAFVEAEPSIDEHLPAETLYEAWLQHGVEVGAPVG